MLATRPKGNFEANLHFVTTCMSKKKNTCNTPFAVYYEKIRIHLHEMATNSTKIHSLVPNNEHLRVTQTQ